jgi:hypothetical protein
LRNVIEAKIDFGKMKNLVKEMSKRYTIKLGLLAKYGGSEEVSENMDIAGLGMVQEYGANIKITPKMAAFLAIKAKELGLPKKEQKGDGYVHIPARSFLYQPIVGDAAGFRKEIRKELDDFAMEYFAEYEDFEELAKIIAVTGFRRINRAFSESGIFGEWAANSAFTIASKGSNKPLIGKEAKLRKALYYEVEKS